MAVTHRIKMLEGRYGLGAAASNGAACPKCRGRGGYGVLVASSDTDPGTLRAGACPGCGKAIAARTLILVPTPDCPDPWSMI